MPHPTPPHPEWSQPCCIFSGILSDIYSDILSGIYSDILSDILSGIVSGVLFGMCSDPGVARCIRSWEKTGVIAPLLKFGDPHISGGELNPDLHFVKPMLEGVSTIRYQKYP